MNRTVFLDRDNTLIANDGDLGDPENVTLLDGVAEGLRDLAAAGYRLVVVTNQGGVARGKYGEADVDTVHQRIARLVDEQAGASRLIDRFYYCPYHPDAEVESYRREHPWRKPNPGMLLQAAQDLKLDLTASWMLGDQPRDMQAGRAAGCRTVLINADETARTGAAPTTVVATFREAVDFILSQPPAAGVAVAPAAPASPTPDPGATEALHRAVADLAAEVRALAERPAPTPAPTPDPPESEAHERLHRALGELAEELRTGRVRRAEFTLMKGIAGVAQLGALLAGVLGLLQLSDPDTFLRWMAAAVLLQLVTVTLLVADSKG